MTGACRPEKYGKVNQQQKFMLRRLIIKQKMSVKQAAAVLKINYSTAKTIMFFHRKSAVVDIFPFDNQSSSCEELMTASYRQVFSRTNIEICSSTGGMNILQKSSKNSADFEQTHVQGLDKN